MVPDIAVRTDKRESPARIRTSRYPGQDESLVGTGTQRLDQSAGRKGHENTRSPLSIERQYGIALGSILIAFFVRFIADSYLGDTLPFVTFLVAIAVTTWYGGIGASLTALILGALLWNWFFVDPRYALTMGSHVDQAGMTIYTAIGVAMIGYVQTWRWAWKQGEGTGGAYHVNAQGVNPKASHHT